MNERFIRTAALLGADATERLSAAKIALFGVGGVGGAVLEALARAGVGNIDVFDNDTVAVTNLNRQLIATEQTIGLKKTDAAELRARAINPDIKIGKFNVFYLPENADSIDLSSYDFIVDAIDTVSAKLELAVRAERLGVPIISIMGTGNKLNPEELKISDIYKTSFCPLCRVMRTELKKRGVKKLTCVWSDEKPIKPNELAETKESGRQAPASAPFVPIAAGILAAAHIVKELTK
ncbi:MAG: tRNA threonylcarbamoyladenosine dehydratase [Clostridia bacterium]|nr:tRNA threonylcarbamoyladenosine dehydratase [Clostridia bacterium]